MLPSDQCKATNSSFFIVLALCSAEFLGEPDQQPFEPAQIAKPTAFSYWTTSPTSLAPAATRPKLPTRIYAFVQIEPDLAGRSTP
ncbi:MAG: hypothetical protein JWN34_5137 [Bryobacterales bacterium]|nr:hypothetical protein [Bryobacterales bacterium]